LQSLKIGKSYISTIGELDFSFYEISDKNEKKEIFFGETLNHNLIELSLSANENIIWKLIVNGEIHSEVIGDKLHIKIYLPKDSYFRIDGYKNNDISVITNPIFFGEILKTGKDWLSIRK
ncbi:MAG: hypothetical protein ACRC6A_08640, partial [Fusobacteriaceae bacterium]